MPAWNWADSLNFPDNYIVQGFIGLWGGWLSFISIPSLYTLGTVPIVLAAELLERIIRRWRINGIMLFAGAVVFAVSRAIAIWHALQSVG